MLVSYEWLSEFVDLSAHTPDSLAKLLTSGGLAVDGIESRNHGVVGVVVGEVREMEHHPDADKLNVCKVDVGSGELLQIVCGAKNVVPGIKVPVALPGAKLPGDKEIKTAKLRGVTSHGMLCSASELGLDVKLLPSSQTSGLYILPEDTVLGENIVRVLHLNDVVLDIDLTPNRSDCLSIRGLVHEIAALTGGSTSFPESIEFALPDATSEVRVKIESSRCVRYDAELLEGLRVSASPLWMQMRLMAMGIRPIDLIVDVTNYVMLEWGQPLHAFDAAAIADATIVVRQATPGEHLVTLDGQDRMLDEEMLVIADSAKAIGLAGVMGGENSEIHGGTTRIVIESARFDAPSTRRTGQKLGLRSEAQQRFEKGIDPAVVQNALLRATQLLCQLAGAAPVGGIATARVAEQDIHVSRTVPFSPDACRALLGCDIDDVEMKTLLGNLGFGVTTHEHHWSVLVSTRRPDITMQADLVEEIARLYGYDKIPATTPSGPVTTGGRDAGQTMFEQLRDRLVSMGLFEVRTYAFTSPEAIAPLHLEENAKALNMIPLLHPMSDERKTLRTHLLPSLAEVAHHNLAHRVEGGAIFELGRVYEAQEQPIVHQPDEREIASLLWFGQTDETFYDRPRAYDFYDAKGVLERLLQELRLPFAFERTQVPYLHPGRCAQILVDGRVVGMLGELHPATAQEFDIGTALYAELDVKQLLVHQGRQVAVEELPRFPKARRDLAIVVKRDVMVGSVLESIGEMAEEHPILRDAQVFDVYVGQGVSQEEKSVAVALQFQAAERTLTEGEIEEVVDAVLGTLKSRFGAVLRG